MYPLKWNAYVIRTYLYTVWTPVTLAGELRDFPGVIAVYREGVPNTFIWTVVWFDGDRGWSPNFSLAAKPGHPRWPFGWELTDRVLASTGGG